MSRCFALSHTLLKHPVLGAKGVDGAVNRVQPETIF